jgi:hypothetical protein
MRRRYLVNKNELLVLKKYESQGWKVIRGGAPDFLMLKVNGGKIEDFIFVEVKNPNSELTYEQAIYREVLEKRLGAKYSVELIQSNHSNPYPAIPTQDIPPHSIPIQAVPLRPSPTHSIPIQTLDNSSLENERD